VNFLFACKKTKNKDIIVNFGSFSKEKSSELINDKLELSLLMSGLVGTMTPQKAAVLFREQADICTALADTCEKISE